MNKKSVMWLPLAVVCIAMPAQAQVGGPDAGKMSPDMSEYYEPAVPVVTPGKMTKKGYVTAPSDAIVLFDGSDLSAWEGRDGKGAEWTVKDGVMTVDKSKGDIWTKQQFGDFQMHIEWMVPKTVGDFEGQSRGNSGLFLQGIYEVQILDSYKNPTYVNGQAASIYKQMPPLVNAMNPNDEWNVYDIIYTAPTFTKEGNYKTPPSVTVLHNGVVVQNHTLIKGTTEYIGFPKVFTHGKGPITLQSHGDPSKPISFRNIWIREL